MERMERMKRMESLKDRWRILQTLHFLFSKSLPITFSPQNGRLDLQGDVLERLKNGITKLKTEIGFNNMQQTRHHNDLERLLHTPAEFDELMESASCLLNEFETWVDDGVLREDEMASPMVGFSFAL
jgi:hypothetical protein